MRSLTIAVLFLAPLQDADKAKQARAVTEQLATSVRLYEQFTGRTAAALSDLTKAAEGIHFWPEGGFVLGKIPKDPWGGAYRLDGRRVVCSKEGISAAVAPPPGTPIVPPTDRLRKFYTARLHIQLLRAAGLAYFRIHDKLPERMEDLGTVPADPWGGKYALVVKDKLVVFRLSDPTKARIEPTKEEIRALTEAAHPQPPEADRKRIADALERMTDDDYEVRLEAEAELKKWGPAIVPLLQDRLKAEKDSYAREWLARLEQDLLAMEDSWSSQLARPAASVVCMDPNELATRCINNLAQLWKMQWNYAVQYGGADKEMPKKTGRDFWLALSRCSPPLIDKTLQDIFVCPGSGEDADADACTYRGPAGNVNSMAEFGDGDPVGMCDDPSHGDVVIILRKSGDVMSVSRSSLLYKLALKMTRR